MEHLRTPRTTDEAFGRDPYSWLDGKNARAARARVLGAGCPDVIDTDTKLLARVLRAIGRILRRHP